MYASLQTFPCSCQSAEGFVTQKRKCTSCKEFVLSVEWASPTGAADTPSVPSVHHCDHLLILKLQTKINPMQRQCKPSSTVMLCNRTQGKFFSMVQLVWPTFLAGCDLPLWLYFIQFFGFDAAILNNNWYILVFHIDWNFNRDSLRVKCLQNTFIWTVSPLGSL